MAASYDAVVFDNDGVLTTPTDRDVLLEAIHDAFESVGVSNPSDEDSNAPRPRPVLASSGSGPPRDRRRRAVARTGTGCDRRPARRDRSRTKTRLRGRHRPRVASRSDRNRQQQPTRDDREHPRQLRTRADRGLVRARADDRGIARKKPTPYYLELAIEDLGARNPLYVGDSRVDVVAADAAGIDAAFVRRDHRLEYDLTDHEPRYEIDSLEALPELV